MSGMIGVVANPIPRSVLFTVCIAKIQTPPNTYIEWAIGSDRIVGRNNIVKAALEFGSEWLLFLDDDHAFPDDALMRLLAHDQDIVGSLYMQRVPPFAPVAYSSKDEDGVYTPLHLPSYPEPGLIEVQAVGTGGMLIKTEVFRAMEEPWFEHGRASEDLIFCDKAHDLGFKVFCDLNCHFGHINPAVIWPARADEEWVVGFSVADNTQLLVKIEDHPEADEPSP